jgi:peptide/nickel transport system permease protein
MRVSALLLARGILCGWLLAICAALPISGMRRGGLLLGLPFTLLLAMPTAAMATACILSETGGPVLVLSLLIAAREFKFLRSLLEGAWRSPHLLQGRAQGLSPLALVSLHIVPNAAPQLCALATLSIVTALGSLVPIEVIFTVPGVGQLAWSAVMNRDIPVLVAVSLLMACVVGVAAMISTRDVTLEAA